ncbi:hypothetical protein HKI87_18g87880 [Chloropicon roscoffensis]|uniref:Uncharacterized protein n=1 Tax=Chloropicon roscoffensis TaxID=1461544 RepID=A0A7S3CAG8_9CHLO|mmetsp:Transcript_2633/g.8002  ORF Transcript_2633/g.8002 Transcript_2633/m.8002 type:complete len:227 (+) Transcript_2633:176-856(+)
MGTRLARQQSGAALALAAALFVTAALRPCVAQQKADCPPEGFDSIEPFNVTAWTDHPWFIQEQMPVFYQKPPFFCVRAKYNMVSDTEIEVYNTASTGSVDGPPQNGGPPLKAVVPNPSEPSKLAVGLSFLPPATYGPYWVVFAGPDEDNYEYGIVSGGAPKIPGASGAGCIAGTEDDTNGSGLWLFTKDAIPKPETVKMLKDKAGELGFDVSVLQPVEHEGCTYDE